MSSSSKPVAFYFCLQPFLFSYFPCFQDVTILSILILHAIDFSFEESPRHDAYVPKFEAELAQFCEKLVCYTSPVGLHDL